MEQVERSRGMHAPQRLDGPPQQEPAPERAGACPARERVDRDSTSCVRPDDRWVPERDHAHVVVHGQTVHQVRQGRQRRLTVRGAPAGRDDAYAQAPGARAGGRHATSVERARP